ncbi:hypothetical protein AB0K00_49315 [Dactylosporangium sp. NPDC049525]|uniref:hypothetical protein n=1 Tax=Dactylosporangium sp. NPDC049525 TaxID=3154730 RepID=UPI0034337B05
MHRTVRLGIAVAALIAVVNAALAGTLFVIAGIGAAGGSSLDSAAPIIIGIPLLLIGVVGAVGVRLMLRGQARGANVAVKGSSLLFLIPLGYARGAFDGGFHIVYLILAAAILAVLIGAVMLLNAAARHLVPR